MRSPSGHSNTEFVLAFYFLIDRFFTSFLLALPILRARMFEHRARNRGRQPRLSHFKTFFVARYVSNTQSSNSAFWWSSVCQFTDAPTFSKHASNLASGSPSVFSLFCLASARAAV